MRAMTGDVQAQIRAFEQGALVRPIPELRTMLLTGEERHSWLNGMVTCNVAELTPGQGAYGLSVTKNGRIQAELWMSFGEEQITIGVEETAFDATLEAMNGYLIMEDADLEASSEATSWWLAHGPQVEAVAAEARKGGAEATLTKLADVDTALIHAPQGLMSQVGEALLSSRSAVLATAEGWERIRIERMFPRFGVDFGTKNYPQEASLESMAVSFNKGCYLGQEAVFMLQKRGHVSKRLVRLMFDSPVALEPEAEVLNAEGKSVGAVTSVVHTDERTMAMAMVRYKQTQSGTELTASGHAATVSCLAERECS